MGLFPPKQNKIFVPRSYRLQILSKTTKNHHQNRTLSIATTGLAEQSLIVPAPSLKSFLLDLILSHSFFTPHPRLLPLIQVTHPRLFVHPFHPQPNHYLRPLALVISWAHLWKLCSSCAVSHNQRGNPFFFFLPSLPYPPLLNVKSRKSRPSQRHRHCNDRPRPTACTKYHTIEGAGCGERHWSTSL